MIIQIVLVLALCALMVYFLKNRNTMRLRAGMRLFFITFLIFAVAATLRPNWVNVVAHFFGVGRGSDLMLYGLVVAFIFFVMNTHLKFKDQERRITTLVRHIAITEAKSGKKPSGDETGSAGARIAK